AILGRSAEKINDLLNFGFGFFDAGDIVEANGWALPNAAAGFTLTEVILINEKEDHEHADNQGRSNLQNLIFRAVPGQRKLGCRTRKKRLNLAVCQMGCDREFSLGRCEMTAINPFYGIDVL